MKKNKLSAIYQRSILILKYLFGNAIYFKNQIYLKKEIHGNLNAQWCIASEHVNEKCIVYSFGVGTDISFDLSIIDKYNLRVFAYDPTPRAIEWVNKIVLPENFVFTPVGLSNYDGELNFYLPKNDNFVSYSVDSITDNFTSLPVNKISTLMSQNGHKYIDILKMDIEGAEYDVLFDIIKNKIHIKQILVEFHYRFSKERLEKTKLVISELQNIGYKVFHISPNGEEFSFIFDL